MTRTSEALARTIAGQPAELARLTVAPIDAGVTALRACRRLWLVGTGTSQHACELGALLLSEAGLDARPVSAAAYGQGGAAVRSGDGLVVVSHTTETAFARAARARALRDATPLVTITGRIGAWPEAIETVAREASETYTAGYTAAVMVLARMAGLLGASRMTPALLGAAAAQAGRALEDPVVDRIPTPDRLLVLAGAGPAAVTAREIALKVREAARLPAEGFEAEYLLHGSAVPLDGRDGLVLVDPDADPVGLVAEVGRAAAAAGVAVSRIDPPGPVHPVLDQIALTVQGQRLALRLARERGHDADAVITGPWAAPRLWTLGGPEPGPG
jgi:glucosamine--fructose-6-phosphate aminotransferase (isomerizing)